MSGYAYSKTSRKRLESCHQKLIKLFESLAEHYNITIICGHRDAKEQNKAYAEGKSKLKFPMSKHNTYPSVAVDAILYNKGLDWNDNGQNYMFVGVVRERARAMGIKIRCGADWDGDFDTDDQTFHDIVHFELEDGEV